MRGDELHAFLAEGALGIGELLADALYDKNEERRESAAYLAFDVTHLLEAAAALAEGREAALVEDDPGPLDTNDRIHALRLLLEVPQKNAESFTRLALRKALLARICSLYEIAENHRKAVA